MIARVPPAMSVSGCRVVLLAFMLLILKDNDNECMMKYNLQTLFESSYVGFMKTMLRLLLATKVYYPSRHLSQNPNAPEMDSLVS